MYCSTMHRMRLTSYYLDLQFAHLPDVEEKNHGRATRERRVQKPCPKCSVDISPYLKDASVRWKRCWGLGRKLLASRCVKCLKMRCGVMRFMADESARDTRLTRLAGAGQPRDGGGHRATAGSGARRPGRRH